MAGIVIVHGGVDMPDSEPVRTRLRAAAHAAAAALEKGRLDAAEAGIQVLEADPLFNAGIGSCLTRDGEVEADAAVADGGTGRYGAVAGLRRTAHPVSVARRVAEATPHVLLVGEGATAFARAQGFPEQECATPEQVRFWQEAMKQAGSGRPLTFNPYTGMPVGGDTTGCVVWDGQSLAAATSTGGAFMKLPGRVGDTPLLGCGLYASAWAAVVCSGLGEAYIRTLAAKQAELLVASGLHPQAAAERTVALIREQQGATGGLIVLDREGRWGHAHNCDSFPAAAVAAGGLIDL